MNAHLAPAAASATELSELARIYEPAVNLVVLERPLDPRLVLAAASLDLGTRLALALHPEQVEATLKAQLPPSAAPLAEDAGRWAQVLADLMGAEELGLRLAVVDKATCPAFHVDRVTVRLILTWLGAGPEVLAEHDLDRRGLGYSGRGLTLAESGLLRPGARPRRLPPQSVGLFKGRDLARERGRGVVHRSPEVPAGGRRVLLTLDVLS